jgi:hypothetical protein
VSDVLHNRVTDQNYGDADIDKFRRLEEGQYGGSVVMHQQ